MKGTKQGDPECSLISCKVKEKKSYPGKKCQAITKLVVITFILFNSVMPRKERSAVSLDIWDQNEV